MRNFKLILLLSLIVFTQCINNKNEELYTVFNSIEKNYDKTMLEEFKETPEKDVLDMYFSFFLYKHSELTDKNSQIHTFFQSLGLNEEPAQVYIFIMLWHRKLNNKALDLDNLLHIINDDIVGIRSCKNLKKINAVFNFKKINKNEDIKLRFPVMTSDGHSGIESTVYYECPVLEWNFNISKDLIINGEVVNKYFKDYYKNTSREFYIQVKVKRTNRENVLYFLNHTQNNDTIEVNLNSYGIKI